MSRVYKKLVRDNIPDIIKSAGKNPKTKKLSEKHYFDELIKKLKEEVEEFSDTPNIEEMADIKEVLLALQEVMGITNVGLDKVRRAKLRMNGGFKKRIYLDSVE